MIALLLLVLTVGVIVIGLHSAVWGVSLSVVGLFVGLMGMFVSYILSLKATQKSWLGTRAFWVHAADALLMFSYAHAILLLIFLVLSVRP